VYWEEPEAENNIDEYEMKELLQDPQNFDLEDIEGSGNIKPSDSRVGFWDSESSESDCHSEQSWKSCKSDKSCKSKKCSCSHECPCKDELCDLQADAAVTLSKVCDIKTDTQMLGQAVTAIHENTESNHAMLL